MVILILYQFEQDYLTMLYSFEQIFFLTGLRI